MCWQTGSLILENTINPLLLNNIYGGTRNLYSTDEVSQVLLRTVYTVICQHKFSDIHSNTVEESILPGYDAAS